MWYYRKPFTYDEASELFFLVETILIPICLGVMLNSVLIFFLFVIGLPILAYYYKIKIMVIGIAIIGTVIFAILGWYIGYFFTMFIAVLFSDKSPIVGMVGGIIGTIFLGLFAISLNTGVWRQIKYQTIV